MAVDGNNLWNYTQGYGATAPKLAYLTDAQNARLERIRISRMLWQGKHRKAYLEEKRTQFDFGPLRAQGQVITPYVTLNLLRLVSTTLTDLLLGAQPLLKVDEAGRGGRQTTLDDLAKRADLSRVFYDAACQASWAGEAVCEVVRWARQVYIRNVSPSEVFPLGERNPDGQYTSYRRFATAKTTENTPRDILLETTYSPGRLQRQAFVLDGSSKTRDADLSLWPNKNPDGSNLLPDQPTGIDWCTMVWMANELDEDSPRSDYDGLIEIQDEFNHAHTALAVVIAKNLNPKWAISPVNAGPDGDLSARKDVFYFHNPDQIPRAITFDAKFAEAMANREFVLDLFCVTAEIPPTLLGIKRDATANSARQWRLMATKALARANRKSTFVKPFMRTALDTALAMEAAGMATSVVVPRAAVDLQDGLPVDDLDQANTLSILTGGKAVCSVKRAVQLQLPDPEAADAELGQLDDEEAERSARNTPAILLGRPADLPANDVGDESNAPDEPDNGPQITDSET